MEENTKTRAYLALATVAVIVMAFLIGKMAAEIARREGPPKAFEFEAAYQQGLIRGYDLGVEHVLNHLTDRYTNGVFTLDLEDKIAMMATNHYGRTK